MQHVAGPFDKKYREFQQPWHVAKFDSVRKDILEQEPDILSDKPENEQVCNFHECHRERLPSLQ